MSQINLTPMGPHRFGVQVEEEDVTTSHEVSVPTSLIDDLGLETDEEAVVRESFEFLLEREPATSILKEFSLDIIPRFFPEYSEELSKRLS